MVDSFRENRTKKRCCSSGSGGGGEKNKVYYFFPGPPHPEVSTHEAALCRAGTDKLWADQSLLREGVTIEGVRKEQASVQGRELAYPTVGKSPG